MPSYELAILLRSLGKAETAKVLKRTALNIYKYQGLLFGIENLGNRPLPYAITSFGKKYRDASYFLMRFDSPATSIVSLRDEYDRDVDIIRTGVVRIRPAEKHECTLENEMKPPAFREDVTKMIEEGRKKERHFDFKTGMSYTPFSR